MRFFQRLAYFCLVSIAILLMPFSRKLRQGVLGRRGLVGRLKKVRAGLSSAPLWFHVSSSGELEQCLPVLDNIREQLPGRAIFVSVFSPSGWRALALEERRRKNAGGRVPWDYADYAPFDFAHSVKRFLDVLKPACFVAVHREMWPCLLEACESRKIPAFLIAAYFPPESRHLFPFYRELASAFSFIGTIEGDSAAFLQRELPGVPSRAIGDPRVERVLSRRNMRQPAPWAHHLNGKKWLICASVWESDFQSLGPSLNRLLTEHPDWGVMVVPHEPGARFVARIERWFEQAGRPAVRWSTFVKGPAPTTALIVDQIGLLAELYSIADLVFVGGSFRARVHNVLEPAAYGRPILTGPYIQNSREAQEMAQVSEGQPLRSANSAEELALALRELIEDEALRLTRSAAATSYLEKRRGAAALYAELILGNVFKVT